MSSKFGDSRDVEKQRLEDTNQDDQRDSTSHEKIETPPGSEHEERYPGDFANQSNNDLESSSRRSSLRRTASGHASMLTTISRLRSRHPQDPTTDRDFSHPLVHEKTGPEQRVDFEVKDDPYRPLNWPRKKKIMTTTLYAFTTMGITFASSVYSAGVDQIATEFGVSMETSTAGISLMLFGFGLGPLIWAPLSELYGRKMAVLTPYFVAAIFSFATGAAKDIQTIMLTRFFAGFFGSAPITNTGGVLGDIWSPQQRAPAIVGYAIAVVGGPTIGPVIGGAVVSSYLGWRWTEYLTGILMMSTLILDVIFLDESYGPVLLVYKARRLRHESGNWALHAEHEEWDVSLRELLHKYMVRPFQLLTTPICFLIALYASFVYGILYANLSSFPIAYQSPLYRDWGPVVGALPFLALLVGILTGAPANLLNNRYYFRRMQQNNGRPVPEARLPPMMAGGIVFAMGLFLFGWTSDPNVNYWPGLVGIGLTGFGFFTIFQAALNYLIDTFTRYGASAVAANTFLRSMLAGAFPLFVNAMYGRLGVDWASTVFACVAVVLVPVPWVFFYFGRRIRARGAWSRPSL